MQRREFIGSVIGFSLGTPFLAKTINKKTLDRLSTFKNLIFAFESPYLRRFKCLVTCNKGEFLSTNVKNVVVDRENTKIEFEFIPIVMTQELTVVSIGLLNERQELLSESYQVIYLVPGCTLDLDYKINLGLS